MGSAVVLVGVVVMLFIFLYRLEQHPHLWFDEGSHLHVSKNLALNGVYADMSSEGLRYSGPVVALGPTVLVPIAGLFKVFGVELFWARLVVVVYAVVMVAGLFALCYRIGGLWLGLVAAAMLVVSPGAELLTYARSVLGEVPGLSFIMVGLWLWLRPGAHSIRRLALTGAVFGLACVTKNQYALVVLPGLLLAWFAEMLWYRQRGHLYFIIPGAVAGVIYFAWMYFVLFLIGRDVRDVNADFAVLRATSAFSFFVWYIGDAVEFLTSGRVYGVLFFPALLYGAALSLRRDDSGQRWGILTVFTLLATLFYLSSLAWPRYAFLAVALAAPLAAKLLFDLSDGFRLRWDELGDLLRGKGGSAGLLSSLFVAGMLVVIIGLPLFWQLRDTVSKPGQKDVFDMAAYIKEHVPLDAEIETLEQEFAILTDHPYHYPPQSLVVDVTAQWVKGGRKSGLNYDNIPYTFTADYVLLKNDLISADFYAGARLTGFEVINTAGKYLLYQRINPA